MKKIAIFLAVIIFTASTFFCLYKNEKISGLVVPHHNIVAKQRAELFSELSAKIAPPETIILVSPNHYFSGQDSIQTTDRDWNLSQGKIIADKNIISFLTDNNLVSIESASFSHEHGIYNILTDIRNNFPRAKIVPLIFKNTQEHRLRDLEDGLLKSCPKCLMIASIDFSHYYPASSSNSSEVFDQRSIYDLKTLNIADILTNAEVDSRSALALLVLWAKDHQSLNFILKNHTDSGKISQNHNLEATTHVFGWYKNCWFKIFNKCII